VKFNATPSGDNINTVVGLTNGPQSVYTSLAAIVRFNPSGFIDAYYVLSLPTERMPNQSNERGGDRTGEACRIRRAREEMSMSADESGGISDLQEVVIETPRGSRNKYKMDEQTGRIKLSKVMPEGMVFPLTLGTSRGQKARMAILWMCLC
jgi:hypothetical protein